MNRGVVLGNLGIVLYKLNRYEESKESLKKGITLCETTFSVACGVFRGALALILAKQSKIEEAFSLLQQGEPQVSIYPEEYGRFLCKKSQIYHMSGQPEEAEQTLQHALDIAKKLKSKPNSELSTLITETKEILSTSPQS